MQSFILPHQSHAYEILNRVARAYFSEDWQKLAVRPRFLPLLTGPSGCGKSHLAQQLAVDLSVPLLELSPSNWILLGCSTSRGAEISWPKIAQFCERNTKGIVFFDEVDKLNGQSDWSGFLRTEVFSLLDRKIPSGLRFDNGEETINIDLAQAQDNLTNGMFMVGAGAFQEFWSSRSQGKIGFCESQSSKDISFTDCSEILPQEIAYRFSQLIPLPALNRAGYLRLLESIVERLPKYLKLDVQKIGMESLDRAIHEQRGCRWGQELVEAALIRRVAAERHREKKLEPGDQGRRRGHGELDQLIDNTERIR